MAGQSLADLIASLPEEERIVMSLHYVQGRTVAEIAALLKVPERAIAHVIANGRTTLMRALGGNE